MSIFKNPVLNQHHSRNVVLSLHCLASNRILQLPCEVQTQPGIPCARSCIDKLVKAFLALETRD